MSERPPTARPEQETKRALYEAFDQVLREGVEGHPPLASASAGRRPRRRSRLLPLSLALLALLGGYVLVARPDWLFPPAPPAEPATVQEAGLRIAMFMQVQRVEMFRGANGRLPATLEESGGALRNLSYHPTAAGTYRLEGTAGAVTLSYASTESLSDFLGNSYGVLVQRGSL